MAGRMKDPAYREQQLAHIRDPHVAPLNALVDELRRPGRFVPYVSPEYGGVQAELLVLLQHPGGSADPSGSGMLSPENDDPTAHRLAEALADVGLPAERIVTWNAVPWVDGDGRPVGDFRSGVSSLRKFVNRCPEVQVVLLAGAQAKKCWDLAAQSPGFEGQRYISRVETSLTAPRRLGGTSEGMARVRTDMHRALDLLTLCRAS